MNGKRMTGISNKQDGVEFHGWIGCTGNRCNLTNEQDPMLAWV